MKPSIFNRANLFIRSLIFWIYSVTTIFLYSFVCLFSLLLPPSVRRRLIIYYMQAYFYVLRKVCHLDYKIEGLENIPQDRKGIIMCKHSSAWETFFLPIYFDMPAAIAKRELAWIPFFGWGLSVTAPIYINRNNKQTAMQQIIEKGKKCLAQGRWIMVFPEGTRVPFGEVGHYKLGGTRLAAATHAPILPIAHNAGWFWPRRTFIKKPGTVTVVIGPLIESEGRKPEELLAETKAWIEKTVERIGKN